MFRYCWLIFLFLAKAPFLSADSGEKSSDFKSIIEPAVLQAEAGEALLGVSYEITYRKEKELAAIERDSDTDFGEINYTLSYFGYEAKGIWANSRQVIPGDFLEISIDGGILHQSKLTVQGGVAYKLEANSSLDNKQDVYGLTSQFGKREFTSNLDQLYLGLNVMQVDPSKNYKREAAIGGALKPFHRWEVLAVYTYNLSNVVADLSEFEVAYRYFKEIAAPSSVEQAGIDRFKISTAKLSLRNGGFISYSSGELPFDIKGQRVFKVGFSWKLK